MKLKHLVQKGIFIAIKTMENFGCNNVNLIAIKNMENLWCNNDIHLQLLRLWKPLVQYCNSFANKTMENLWYNNVKQMHIMQSIILLKNFRVMPLVLQLLLVMMSKYSKFGVDTFNTF